MRIETLGSGDLARQINQALDAVAEDVVARPHVTGARKVQITITVAPRVEGEGQNYPEITTQVRRVLPPWSGSKTRGIVHQGRIEIGQFAREPLQESMFDGEESQP